MREPRPLSSELQGNYDAFLAKLATEGGAFYQGSDNGIKAFLALKEDKKKEYIDSTKISITEEEFYFARRFLALIYLTGGEHFTKTDGSPINHKQVYQSESILPAIFDQGDEAFIVDGSKALGDKIEHLASKITPQQVDKFYQRLVEKRPSYFYGSSDKAPQIRLNSKGDLDVENYISYSEMGLSAMIQVAGKTNFINDGNRYNSGFVSNDDDHEKEGHIAGLIGPRVEIDNAMEPLQLVKGKHKEQKDLFKQKIGVSSDIQTADFGRIKDVNQDFVEGHELIWNKFYQGQSEIADEGQLIEQRLQHRLYISYKKFLAHAVENSSDQKKAYIRVSGIGDGAWCVGKPGFAKEIGLAVGGAFAKALSELTDDQKSKIGTVHFSQFGHDNYQKGFDQILANTQDKGIEKTSDKITKFGNIKISSCQDAPFSSKLPDNASDQELFNLYAWDAGSLPGNEFFHRKPSLSGDPAAACCSAIGVTANPNVNKALLTSIKVVKKDYTFQALTGFKPQEADLKVKAPDPVLAHASSHSAMAGLNYDDTKINEMEEVLKDLFGVDKVTKLESDENFYINFPIASQAEFDNAFQQASLTSKHLKNNYQIGGGDAREQKSVVAHIGKKVDYKGEKEDLRGQNNLHSVGILLTFEDVDQIIKKQKEIAQKKADAERFKNLMSSNKGVDISIEPPYCGDVSCGVSLGKDKAKAEEIIQYLFNAGIRGGRGEKKALIAVDKENERYYFDGSLSEDRIKEYKIILSEANKAAIESNDGKFNQIFGKIKEAQEAPGEQKAQEAQHTQIKGKPDGSSEFWNNAKPWVVAGVAGGVIFGGSLLCASALGFAVVSAPVIVPAVIVGGAVAVVAFNLAKNSNSQSAKQ
jgi:hypothetical protein